MATEKELQDQIKTLTDKVSSLRSNLKAVKADKRYHYILNGNEVVAKSSEKIPEHGNFAHWSGEKGKKILKTSGNFKEQVAKLAVVTGMSYRITPILKSLGFKFNANAKIWINPAVVVSNDISSMFPV